MNSPKKWDYEEIMFLEENYSILGVAECAVKLGRSYSSVQSKAKRLKIYYEKWYDTEVEFLLNNYCEKGVNWCAKKLKRGSSSILHKVSRLGLRRRGIGRNSRYYLYDGYIVISEVNERFFLHRKIMEEHLNRPLTSDEIVHHIDGDKLNNDINNLIIVDRAEHMRLHDRPRNEFGQYI